MNWLRFWVAGTAGLMAAAAQTVPPMETRDPNVSGNQAADRGDFRAAEPYYRQAVEKFRALGPGYEAHLAASLINVGAASCGQGKRAEGAQYFEEALALHRRSLGPKHIRTVINLNRMATNYLTMGNSDRAESLFTEALAIERGLYSNHEQLAQTLNGLVGVRLRKGQTAELLPMAEEALAVARKSAGDDNVVAAQMYAGVAEVHRLSGRPDRAIPLYRKARFIYERALGKDDIRAAAILSQEGLILMDEGKLTLAGQSLEHAVDVLLRSGPSYFPELSLAENNLGVLRLKQKRYAEADRLLGHVLALQEKYLAQPGKETAETLRNLSVVREKEQLPADAARLRNRATLIMSYR